MKLPRFFPDPNGVADIMTKSKDGQYVRYGDHRKEILKLIKALAFYGDPATYFAVGFLPDPPNGPIMDDFSDTDLGKKPGKLAREVLEEYK